MKIDAIRLRNVRRFGAEGIELGPILDGVSLLAQDNEFGKTTLFDALKMVFFVPYTSKGAKLKTSIQPYGTDEPAEIEVDFTTGGTSYRLYKRYFRARPTALLLDPSSDRILARDGEAEDRLSDLLGTQKIGEGPQGLLWVAQGAGLDRPTPGTEHQSLLSSLIEGEVTDTTSGEAARAVLEAARGRLHTLVTERRAQPTGPYREALDAADAARADHEALLRREAALEDDLSRLAQIETRIAEAADPERAADLAGKLERAEAHLTAAKSHAQRVRTLEETARAAGIEAREADGALLRLDQDRQRAGALAEAQTRTTARLADLSARLAVAEEEDSAARTALSGATEALAQAETQERAARAGHERQERKTEAARLAEQCDIVRQLTDERDALPRPDPRALLSDPALERLTRLDAAVTTARATLSAQSPRVSLSYESADAPRVRLGTAELGDTPLAVQGTGTLALPGIGTLTIVAPEAEDAARALHGAEEALRTALAETGAASLADAHKRRREAEAQKAARAAATEKLAAVCPEGLPALERRLEEIGALLGPEAETPDLQAAQAALAAAHGAMGDAKVRATEARSALGALRADLARTEADQERERAEAAALEERLGGTASPEEAMAAARAARERAEAARVALDDARAGAPDLLAAEASVDRLRKAIRQQDEDRQRLRMERAEVLATIRHVRDQGLGEALADAAARAEHTGRAAAAYAEEVAGLTLLVETIDGLRRRARDAFLAPVTAAARPLLQTVFPGADLDLGDDFGPDALRRGDLQEPLDRLSGGTREQIAIVTRLAFAQIMARRGAPVPVILDDPAVFGDETRTERLFDLFERAGRETQLILLTCHRSRYASAGAQPLRFAPWQKPPHAKD